MEDRLLTMTKKERRAYEKGLGKNPENNTSISTDTGKKKKKLIIKETLPEPSSVIVLPNHPVIEKEDSMKNELPRYNETFIDVLERLSKLMSQKGDTIRSRVYSRAQDTIRTMNEDITSISQLDGKPNIGPTIKEKLTEYVETGTLQLFEREKDKPEYMLSEIYGIGPKKARDLVEKGISTIEQLRERQDELLNDVQKIGLTYYEDILERIPRSEIDEYNRKFKEVFTKVLQRQGESIGQRQGESIGQRQGESIGQSEYEIVGSYRRGAHTSGDIDLIIKSNDGTVFSQFIDELVEQGIIIEILSKGKTKCLVIAKLPGHTVARRVDFMNTSKEEYPFAILYFTGSKGFNTVMRSHALKMGLSLNEHGLYKKQQGKEKEEKISRVFEKESDIFDHLQLEYREPKDRIDGRSVVLKNGSIMPLSKPVFLKKKLHTLKVSPKSEKKDKPLTLTLTLKKERVEKSVEENVEKKVEKNVEEKVEKKQKRTYKKREPKTGVSPNALVKPKRTYKKRATKEQQTIAITEINVLYSPEPIEEVPIVPVIPLETQTAAKIELEPLTQGEPGKKTRKKREVNHNKSKKIKGERTDIKMNPEVIEKDMEKVERTEEKVERTEEKVERTEEKVEGTEEKVKNGAKKNDAKKNVKVFKEKGFSFLESLNEKEITDMIVTANDAYYNTKKSLMTDNEYDIVKEYAEKTYPMNETIKQVGAPIEKNKVTLPFNMPSMDKIKPDTNALQTFTNKYKGPYVLSCKLDGVSGLYVHGDTPKLYTRGDGTVGQDITHVLRVLKMPDLDSHNQRTDLDSELVVRGEFILPKQVFEEKYKEEFANPRNLVSGIINSKSLDNKTRDLHFVAYEIIRPLIKPSEQLAMLKRLGFEVVQNKIEDQLTNELLSEVLIDWRTHYEYEMDGLIVTDDNMHARKEGNPDYAFAFKMVISDQIAEAKVVDVIWNASKSGYLKPRVRIEPIKLGGVTIEYASGFNGSFIETNKIGVGAVIQIIRSGDVIPHIKSVTVPAEHAKMPEQKYHWTDKHVDIVLDDLLEDTGVKEKEITAFFTGLDVDGLSIGNVKRIVSAGFDSVPKIIKMSKTDFETVEGFKSKMIEKVYTSLHDKIRSATLLEIMAVSNQFGRGIGERKIRPILEAYPDILVTKESADEKIAMLKSIKGIGKENAKAFVEHIDGFMEFLRECDLEGKLTKSGSGSENDLTNTMVASFDASHPLYQKHIVMTKVRDQTIIEGLKQHGGVLDDSIGKNTFVLIVKSKEDVSNKTKYANDHEIPIMTPSEFISTYL